MSSIGLVEGNCDMVVVPVDQLDAPMYCCKYLATAFRVPFVHNPFVLTPFAEVSHV
jgi:hypothetical protein